MSFAHRKRISLVHSPSISKPFFCGISAASFRHVKGKLSLSLRKQQILPHLVKDLQDVAGYSCGPQLGSEF